jgi:hypothetical protein
VATEIREAKRFDPAAIARRMKRELDQSVKALRNNEDGAVGKILDLLKKLDKDLRREIAGLDPDLFRASHLDRLQSVVQAAVADFSARAQTIASLSSIHSVQLAAARVAGINAALATVPGGSGFIVPVVPNELLSVVSSMSAELVRGLAADVEKQVVGILQRAVLGSKTPFEAARQISGVVGSRGNVGATAAAERIVRTEVNRAFNAADHTFDVQANERRPEDLPALKKIWVATLDDRTRESHRRAHGQVRFIDEPFNVGGEELDYPSDPSGSAGNTINCRCTRITVPEELVDEMKAQISA